MVAGFLVPPDPGTDSGTTKYADYVFAVNQQQIVNSTGTGMQRFNPNRVAQAQAEFARLKAKYPAPANWQDHWNEDVLFSQPTGSTMRVAAQVGRYREIDFYQGDAYGQNGYIGQTTSTLTRDKDVFYVENWTYTPPTGTP